MSDTRPSIVIIGAGKTGRGFIGRLAQQSGYPVVYVDRDPEVIERLRARQGYWIHFFDEGRDSIHIHNYDAVLSGTSAASTAIRNALMVFTAVGEQNLPAVADYLGTVFENEKQMPSQPRLIFTCENGTSPGRVLRDKMQAIGANHCIVSETAIFCTTVESQPRTNGSVTLDMQSESFDELPYDAEPFTLSHTVFRGLDTMVPEQDFSQLLLRKIYTYNCISACISYLGAYKGYESYADAANDDEVSDIVETIVASLNRVLAQELAIPMKEQEAFSTRAFLKFRNPKIRDSILRNARAVPRKLSRNERLIGPALLFQKYGESTTELSLVIALACRYGYLHDSEFRDEMDQNDAADVLSRVTGLDKNHEIIRSSVNMFRRINPTGHDLKQLLEGEGRAFI